MHDEHKCGWDCPNVKYIVQYLQQNHGRVLLLACRGNMSITDLGWRIHFKTKQLLSKNLTDPPELPPVLPFRMVHCLLPPLGQETLSAFCEPQSKLRLIIATSAFGLGADCPCIRHISHWGAPNIPRRVGT